MLTLRQDWLSVTSGAVVAGLVAQAESLRMRDEDAGAPDRAQRLTSW